MIKTEKECNEIRRVLGRLSPKNVERLRNYAIHLELEESEGEEPPLTAEEEEGLIASKKEIAEGKGLSFKKAMNELW